MKMNVYNRWKKQEMVKKLAKKSMVNHDLMF